MRKTDRAHKITDRPEIRPVTTQVRIEPARRGNTIDPNLQSQLINQLITRGYQFGPVINDNVSIVRADVYYCKKEEEGAAIRLKGSIVNILEAMLPGVKIVPDSRDACGTDPLPNDNTLTIQLQADTSPASSSTEPDGRPVALD